MKELTKADMKGCRSQGCKVPTSLFLGIFIALWIFVCFHFGINKIENNIEAIDITGKCNFIRQFSIPLSKQHQDVTSLLHNLNTTDFLNFLKFIAKRSLSVDSAKNISHNQILSLREIVKSTPDNVVFFYNRVPKCSSRSVQSVVSHSQHKGLVKIVSSSQYCIANISAADQVSWQILRSLRDFASLPTKLNITQKSF